MPTFQKCDESVHQMAREILCEFPSHKPLLDARLKIDFVFAFGDRDEQGNVTGDALKLRGQKCLGVARKIKLKDRVLGRGDVEVSLDGDWWADASVEDQRALLDHELHHFVVETDSNGKAITDDITRPKVSMRKHDFEFGWFAIIAERHGKHSQECQQAKLMADAAGQFLFPGIHFPAETI